MEVFYTNIFNPIQFDVTNCLPTVEDECIVNSTVATMLVMLMAAGTAYENHLDRCQRRKDKAPSNNNVEADVPGKLGSPLEKATGELSTRGHSDSDISTSDSFKGTTQLLSFLIYKQKSCP